MHILYKRLLGSGFTSWSLVVIQREYMGSPVYDKEAKINHRSLITLDVMCLASTEKCEMFNTLLSEDRSELASLYNYNVDCMSSLFCCYCDKHL